MERKIGEIFEYNGEWYQCVEGTWCRRCDLHKSNLSTSQCDYRLYCLSSKRKDNKSVVFKKLEKLGEPFISAGILYQHYKLFDIDNVCGDGFWCVHKYKEKTIIVEIKQNKEMKTIRISKDDLNFLVNKIRYGILPKHANWDEIISEITDLFSVEDVNLSNTEKIGKKLREFDLEAAKSGKPVCTRDGRKARIICFDAKCADTPIVALVSRNDGEILLRHYKDGKLSVDKDSDADLMMLPEKKEG